MIQTISPNDDLVLDVVLTDKSGNVIDESLIANLQFVVYTEGTSELQRVYLSKTRYNDGELLINSSELSTLSSGQLYLTTAIALLNSQYNDGSFDYIKTSALPYYLKNPAMSVSDDEAILQWKINVTKSLQNIDATLRDISVRLLNVEAASGDTSAISEMISNALESYATIEYVDEQDAGLAASIQPEVDLTPYATTEDVNAAISAIPQPDLTPYALKASIPSLEGYATEQYVDEHDASVANAIPSVDGFATETFVTEQVGNIDLTPYATTEDVSTALADKADKTEIPSMVGYATEQYVDNAVADVSVDLTGYATESYVDEHDASVANAIPSISGLATETFVTQQIENIDLTPFATTADVSTALAGKADAAAIPSLEGYATDASVAAAIEAIPQPDLTPYATTADVSTALAGKANTSDLDNYVTDTSLGTILEDYTSHVEMENVESAVATTINRLAERVENIEETLQDDTSTGENTL